MKGVVNIAIKEFVLSKFNKQIWLKIVEKANVKDSFSIILSYPDEITLKLIESASEILNIPADKIHFEFGKFLIKTYVHKMYSAFFVGKKDTIDFLKNINWIHETLTKNLKRANPPKFIIEEKAKNIIILHYISEKNLPDLLEGILNGLLEYFNQEGNIKRIESNKPEAVCAFIVECS